jgi:hypothetical protein
MQFSLLDMVLIVSESISEVRCGRKQPFVCLFVKILCGSFIGQYDGRHEYLHDFVFK